MSARSLDHPAVPAESLAGLDAAPGDAWDDSTSAQEHAQVRVVIPLVAVQLGRTATTWPAPGTDRRGATHERFQRLAVVGVDGADHDRDGEAGPVGDDMDLRPLLASIYRIRTCQICPFMARTLTESIAHRAQSNSPREPSSSSKIRCSLAHTRAPLHSVKRRCTVCQEAPKTGGSCRQVQPVVPRTRSPPESGSHPLAAGRLPGAVSRRGDHPLEQLPQFIRNQPVQERRHNRSND